MIVLALPEVAVVVGRGREERSLMPFIRALVIFITGLFIIGLLPLSRPSPALGQDSTSPAPSSGSQTVTGQLVMLAGEVAVIKDSSGKTTHLSISKATKIERGLKDGDTVEVAVSSDGQALSIKPSK
jgi:hypothetical protein